MLLFFPPEAVIRGPLPKKPLIIAYRSASTLAPENTMSATNLATDIGVYGLGTDIHVNRDGELLLLHDEIFDRPTDIKVFFPGWYEESAENFTQAEINKLNVGNWFLELDLFLVISRGSFTTEQLVEYQQ